jgi:hypothetical protein
VGEVVQLYDFQRLWMLVEHLCRSCGCLDVAVAPLLDSTYPRTASECAHCGEMACVVQRVWTLAPMSLRDATRAAERVVDGDLEGVGWRAFVEVVS